MLSDVSHCSALVLQLVEFTQGIDLFPRSSSDEPKYQLLAWPPSSAGA